MSQKPGLGAPAVSSLVRGTRRNKTGGECRRISQTLGCSLSEPDYQGRLWRSSAVRGVGCRAVLTKFVRRTDCQR